MFSQFTYSLILGDRPGWRWALEPPTIPIGAILDVHLQVQHSLPPQIPPVRIEYGTRVESDDAARVLPLAFVIIILLLGPLGSCRGYVSPSTNTLSST